jgi:hypothetical protein
MDILRILCNSAYGQQLLSENDALKEELSSQTEQYNNLKLQIQRLQEAGSSSCSMCTVRCAANDMCLLESQSYVALDEVENTKKLIHQLRTENASLQETVKTLRETVRR